MKKLVLVASIFLFTFLFSTINVLACSCPDDPDATLQQKVRYAFFGATSIFSGEVVEIIPHTTYRNSLIVKFKVEKLWKGKDFEQISITTANDSAMCGYDNFIIGKKYLVYAFGKKDYLETDICTRTKFLQNNKDIKFLDKLEILWKSKKPIKL